jgi:hypothetical protein
MGRPRKYETVEELEYVIDGYFATCLSNDIHPTITGLALALDLDRMGLIRYQGRPEFSDAIKRAKARVENYIEQTLLEGRATAGAIFNLKNNFGWIDEKQHQVSGELGVRSVKVTGR